MNASILPLAPAGTLLGRMFGCAMFTIVGVLLILSGINNIRTRTAEESGGRRMVNEALGRSNTYRGTKAVLVGYLRVVMGVFGIIFGIFFLFVGPFLAN